VYTKLDPSTFTSSLEIEVLPKKHYVGEMPCSRPSLVQYSLTASESRSELKFEWLKWARVSWVKSLVRRGVSYIYAM
jgi:hypothetical protein